MLLDLLPELQENIFAYLECGDLRNLACTSNEVNGLLKELMWTRINVKKKHLVSPHFTCTPSQKEGLQYTQTFSVLAHSFQQHETEIIARNFYEILKHCNPTSLYACLRISDDVLKYIGNISGLLELHLDGTSITDVQVQTICKEINSLTVLSLRMSTIYDNALSQIQLLTNLECLDVSATKITHYAFLYLNSSVNLRELYLEKIRNLGNDGMSYLCSLTGLKKLSISSASVHINDEGIALLSVLHNLNYLSICDCIQITGVCFSRFSTSNNLRELRVFYCGIQDVHCSTIAAIPTLRTLDIHRNPITSDGVRRLSVMLCLEDLDISLCPGVLDVSSLALLVALKKVNLTGTGVTDAGVEELRVNATTLTVIKKF